jgi:thioredoxin-dependent peroxiredoxin
VKVSAGDPAPLFTLPDQDGRPWSLEERRGRPVVIYIYPKDDPPGSSNQACEVRDHWDEFTSEGAEVVGVSPDDVASHAAFAEKYDLPHRLLADTDRAVIDAYGAWGEKTAFGRTVQGVIRSSVVVAADGTVAAVFDRIKPDEQSRRSLEVVRSLTSSGTG